MVDIVLATYNGEKFLSQQLYSLLAQTYEDWRCIIHDDGSTDKTVDIAKEFASIDKRFILKIDGAEFGNAGKNFMHTLSYSDSEYVCFCDQDDVWLGTKLEKLISVIEKQNKEIPQVVFSNAYLWRNDKNEIFGKATLAFPTDIESLLFLNCGIQGASAIFNKKMRDCLLIPLENLVMHDWYLTIIGCTFGEIHYLHENLMLYRQHGLNITGYADGSMKNKLFSLFKRNTPLVDLKHLNSLKVFFQVWGGALSEKDRKNIEKFIKVTEKNNIARLRFILGGKWRIYDSRKKLIAKFFVRPYIARSK
ncbi:glycosyltransferase family 2 protein [Treponema vincentii]|uniref:glycosyltransferase family 2 protein n=1 Tax=Treponema vincentii TaxID=69710 RepID=UPI0020A3D3B5|nr:glycosyltransferase family 2 protein [Treponema vincentii]UTC45863.1 glycosyltransferase family 2 protein [Treponema vincentii]